MRRGTESTVWWSPLLALSAAVLLLLAFAPELAAQAGNPSHGTSSSRAANGTARKRRVDDDRAGTIISKAETALTNQDYPTAERLLKEAVTDDPQDFRAWYDLGFLYDAIGKKQDSIDAYRKSVAADPTVFESNLHLGLMLAQLNDPEAERYLRAATKLKPSSHANEGLARASLSLGHVLEARDSAGALAAYAEAARLQPRDPEPHLSAGALLARDNKADAAEKEFRTAAELDPKSGDAVVGLAEIYSKAGRLPEAESALRKYVFLNPQNPAGYFQLARILVAEHKRYDAIEALENGLKLAPAERAAQRELAALYDVAGKFDKSESVYRSLLTADPKDALAHAGLGSALLHQRKPVQAQDELLAALQLDPQRGEVYGDLAIAASENKNYPLTIRALDQRARLGVEETPGTYFLRATAYDNLHDRKNAAEYYRQFLQVANGRFPDQEWQARHRLVAIAPEKKR